MLVAKRAGVEYEPKYHAAIYQILRILRSGHKKNLTVSSAAMQQKSLRQRKIRNVFLVNDLCRPLITARLMAYYHRLMACPLKAEHVQHVRRAIRRL
jgi:hypothetical protein